MQIQHTSQICKKKKLYVRIKTKKPNQSSNVPGHTNLTITKLVSKQDNVIFTKINSKKEIQ